MLDLYHDRQRTSRGRRTLGFTEHIRALLHAKGLEWPDPVTRAVNGTVSAKAFVLDESTEIRSNRASVTLFNL